MEFVTGDLVAHCRFVEQFDLGVHSATHQFTGFPQPGDMRRFAGELEFAAQPEVAVDRFSLNQLLDVAHRVVKCPVEAAGLLQTLTRHQRGEVLRHTGIAVAAVARRCLAHDVATLQQHHADAAARQAKGCRDAGEAAANHHHVRLGGQRFAGSTGKGRSRGLPERFQFHGGFLRVRRRQAGRRYL